MENNKMEFNIESPFSFDLGDELFPLPYLPPIDISTAAAAHDQLPLYNKNNNKPKKGSRRNPLPPTSIDESLNEHKKKKIIHRDVERQRRQDMTSLYSTLRSLLPLEYLKGNRSVCNHVHETVRYIQHMEDKIQHLSKRRDELKMLSGKDRVSSTVEMLNSSSIGNSVMVKVRNESKGVQVIVDTGTQNMNLVSNILQVITAEGLEILSYNSAKVNERFLHTIECHAVVKVDDCQSIDVSELQHKLMSLDYRHFD